ncbi:hypothetical protein C7B65_08815 [Phormidesmis priestleyi ULC007]|uniref:Uncharacterized protein n=1 Tax=Phormidesmis priestleyi ULC007 TaxID=1920490 RepID=A0A2T1DI39_9CYAN|nr:hypothetical protein C7B65_08815 [Phormidesmis priestleyi ULC007]PZO49073.1 MAG: hypothetical protein DCF14_15135 [Phormidesmis priestleyi]
MAGGVLGFVGTVTIGGVCGTGGGVTIGGVGGTIGGVGGGGVGMGRSGTGVTTSRRSRYPRSGSSESVVMQLVARVLSPPLALRVQSPSIALVCKSRVARVAVLTAFKVC